MRHLSQTEKDFIQANSVKDSGVICWESWHSADDTIMVTNINPGGPGFDADRIYTLTQDGDKKLVSKENGEVLDMYTDLMLAKYKKELKSLREIDKS